MKNETKKNIPAADMDFNKYVNYHMELVNSTLIDVDTYQRDLDEEELDDIQRICCQRTQAELPRREILCL